MSLGDWWTCWLCGKPFTHARLLARHLMNLHQVMPPSGRCQTPLMR